jgi:hypothetical protein
MSSAKILAALETALATVTPALATHHEAMPFDPVPGVPYQRVTLLTGEPVNATYGGNDWREQGIFQVTLCYPAQASGGAVGSRPARAQADLVRAAFARGTSLTFDGVTVVIETTPSIAPAMGDGDRFCVPVRIRYFAQVHAGPVGPP